MNFSKTFQASIFSPMSSSPPCSTRNLSPPFPSSNNNTPDVSSSALPPSFPPPSSLALTATYDFDNTDEAYLKAQNYRYSNGKPGIPQKNSSRNNCGHSTNQNHHHVHRFDHHQNVYKINHVVSHYTNSFNRATSLRSCAKGDRPSRKAHFVNPSKCSTTKFNGMRRNWTFLNLSDGLATMAADDLEDGDGDQNMNNTLPNTNDIREKNNNNNNNNDMEKDVNTANNNIHHHDDALSLSEREILDDLDENDWDCIEPHRKKFKIFNDLSFSQNDSASNLHPTLQTQQYEHRNEPDFQTNNNSSFLTSTQSYVPSNLLFKVDQNSRKRLAPQRQNILSSSNNQGLQSSSSKQLHWFFVSNCPIIEGDSSLSSSPSSRSCKDPVDLNVADFILNERDSSTPVPTPRHPCENSKGWLYRVPREFIDSIFHSSNLDDNLNKANPFQGSEPSSHDVLRLNPSHLVPEIQGSSLRPANNGSSTGVNHIVQVCFGNDPSSCIFAYCCDYASVSNTCLCKDQGVPAKVVNSDPSTAGLSLQQLRGCTIANVELNYVNFASDLRKGLAYPRSAALSTGRDMIL